MAALNLARDSVFREVHIIAWNRFGLKNKVKEPSAFFGGRCPVRSHIKHSWISAFRVRFAKAMVVCVWMRDSGPILIYSVCSPSSRGFDSADPLQFLSPDVSVFVADGRWQMIAYRRSSASCYSSSERT